MKSTSLLSAFLPQPYEKKTESIFRSFIEDYSYTMSFTSPLRIDENPSCTAYFEHGVPKIHDLAKGKTYSLLEFYIEYIKIKEGRTLTKYQAIAILNELSLAHSTIPPRKDRREKELIWSKKIKTGDTFSVFNEKTLKAYRIHSLETYSLNSYIHKPQEAYLYTSPDGGQKIYQPNASKQEKWTLVTQTSFYDGEWLLSPIKHYSTLFITTSRKDSCVLYELGFMAINPFNTEREIIDIDDLRKRYKFDKVIYIRDNDATGEEVSRAYEAQGCSIGSTPEGKDPYVYFTLPDGKEKTNFWLKQMDAGIY